MRMNLTNTTNTSSNSIRNSLPQVYGYIRAMPNPFILSLVSVLTRDCGCDPIDRDDVSDPTPDRDVTDGISNRPGRTSTVVP